MDNSTSHGLHKTLNLRDLFLLNIASVVGLSSLAQVAQFGFSSVTLYLLAIFMFLIPSGLMVAELNARMPEEGGFYLWTRHAFGDLHGYIVAWTYWLCNIVWFPTVLLLISTSSLYILGDKYLDLTGNTIYNLAISLFILWMITLLNIFGLERAKWIQNIGATATWVGIIFLVAAGFYYVSEVGFSQEFNMNMLVPNLHDISLLPFFAVVAFSYGGLELAPLMANEIENPKKNLPRSVLYSSIAIGLIYMAGTLILVIAIPGNDISIIEGVAQAFQAMSMKLELPWMGVIGGLIVTLSTLGLFGAWMTGTARIPFVIGLDHYLPPVVGKIHSKYGSPYISLLMQAIVVTLLLSASFLGSTIKEAFLILYDMSIILFYIPFIYMFLALLWHTRNKPEQEGLFVFFKKRSIAVWVVSLSGLSITIFSTIVSVIPSREVINKELFILKVVGGAMLLIMAGLVVYLLKKRNLLNY